MAYRLNNPIGTKGLLRQLAAARAPAWVQSGPQRAIRRWLKPLRYLPSLLAVGLGGLPSTTEARDDLQWWPAVYAQVWKHEAHTLSFYGESWITENATRQKLWLASTRYGYALHPNLTIGANYTYLEIRNLNNSAKFSRNRYEFEINPHFKLGKKWTFELRNRLELAYDSDAASSVNIRSRHRFQFTRKLVLAPLTKIYANTEFFYSYETDQWSESRTVPVGLQLRLSDPIKLNIHYMIQSKRTKQNAHWNHDHILGTTLVLVF